MKINKINFIVLCLLPLSCVNADSQITIGDQSPAINATGDVNINYGNSTGENKKNDKRNYSYVLSNDYETIFDDKIIEAQWRKRKNIRCESFPKIIRFLLSEKNTNMALANFVEQNFNIDFDNTYEGGFIPCNNGNPISYVIRNGIVEPSRWSIQLIKNDGASEYARGYIQLIVINSPYMPTESKYVFNATDKDFGIKITYVPRTGPWDMIFSQRKNIISVKKFICENEKYPALIGYVHTARQYGQSITIAVVLSAESCGLEDRYLPVEDMDSTIFESRDYIKKFGE